MCAIQTGTRTLRTPAAKQIGWWGMRGMSWAQFRTSVESNVLLNKTPDIIFINLGSNDLRNMSSAKLRNIFKRELNYIRVALPYSLLVWIDILPRLNLSGAGESERWIDRKRKSINRWGRLHAAKFAKFELVSVPVDSDTPGFFRSDGVHLSDVGLELYLDCIRDVILKYS
ncbi:hypothetical protein DPMN_102656 [Dreissena polymorpha]|uniref:SGNH hydrolase-type esterase domain-containing protein n=1 Tax=Dreissena polymorpha TaxID=45954 RepID=A0A9D4LJE9_DREPO|nr:hypothetical protein DPMN_102656 [Dreissena polymorpha]